jgi:hypothetical protein
LALNFSRHPVEPNVMRTTISSQAAFSHSNASRGFHLPCGTALLAVLAAAGILLAAQATMSPRMLSAQTPTASSAHKSKSAHSHKRRAKVSAAAVPPAVAAIATGAAPAPVKPATPEPPKWPVNEKPATASVQWDSHGLRIEARNSSLEEILKEVSTATGAKVEGLDSDERVFGSFGPGRARDVLSKLLEGSGYNVLMIGDQGQGAPRQIVLTARHAGEAQPAISGNPVASNDDDADTDDQPQPPAPTTNRPVFAPGAAPRTPQQIEMQQRMQQQRTQQPQPPQN